MAYKNRSLIFLPFGKIIFGKLKILSYRFYMRYRINTHLRNNFGGKNEIT